MRAATWWAKQCRREAQLSPRELRVLGNLARGGGAPIEANELAGSCGIAHGTLHVVISQLRWRFGPEVIDTVRRWPSGATAYALSPDAVDVLAAIAPTHLAHTFHPIVTRSIGKASTEAEGYAHG